MARSIRKGPFIDDHLAKKVEAMIEETRMEESKPQKKTPLDEDPLAPECTFDDFMKVDLRIARIDKAEPVEGADKLLALTLDLGEGPGLEVVEELVGLVETVERQQDVGESAFGEHQVAVTGSQPTSCRATRPKRCFVRARPPGAKATTSSASKMPATRSRSTCGRSATTVSRFATTPSAP